jgi:hypothetical protein
MLYHDAAYCHNAFSLGRFGRTASVCRNRIQMEGSLRAGPAGFPAWCARGEKSWVRVDWGVREGEGGDVRAAEANERVCAVGGKVGKARWGVGAECCRLDTSRCCNSLGRVDFESYHLSA